MVGRFIKYFCVLRFRRSLLDFGFWHSGMKLLLMNIIRSTLNSCFHMLTHNALKNLIQSIELVVTFCWIHKVIYNMHPFCGWVHTNAGSVRSCSSVDGFSASLGLSEHPKFKVELDFILKTQSIGWNEVISSFNLSRITSNLKEQSS